MYEISYTCIYTQTYNNTLTIYRDTPSLPLHHKKTLYSVAQLLGRSQKRTTFPCWKPSKSTRPFPTSRRMRLDSPSTPLTVGVSGSLSAPQGPTLGPWDSALDYRFLRVAKFVCVCLPVPLCVRLCVCPTDDSFIYVTRLMHICDMTHSYMWHDADRRRTARSLQFNVWR